jgi:hypothetical protein
MARQQEPETIHVMFASVKPVEVADDFEWPEGQEVEDEAEAVKLALGEGPRCLLMYEVPYTRDEKGKVREGDMCNPVSAYVGFPVVHSRDEIVEMLETAVAACGEQTLSGKFGAASEASRDHLDNIRAAAAAVRAAPQGSSYIFFDAGAGVLHKLEPGERVYGPKGDRIWPEALPVMGRKPAMVC